MSATHRIALFGGTFDPIHLGHLTIANEAARLFALDQVVFIPAANPPHKSIATPYEDRLKMVELACARDPRFVASRLEADSARKSYSIDTIERWMAAASTNLSPTFIIGADAFSEITTWHRWQDVVGAVEFIVVARRGHVISPPPNARVHRLETLALPVSSSEIRKRLREGGVPAELQPNVLDHIRRNHLYQNQ